MMQVICRVYCLPWSGIIRIGKAENIPSNLSVLTEEKRSTDEALEAMKSGGLLTFVRFIFKPLHGARTSPSRLRTSTIKCIVATSYEQPIDFKHRNDSTQPLRLTMEGYKYFLRSNRTGKSNIQRAHQSIETRC